MTTEKVPADSAYQPPDMKEEVSVVTPASLLTAPETLIQEPTSWTQLAIRTLRNNNDITIVLSHSVFELLLCNGN